MALVARAAARGVPVFTEMGTVNPVVVTEQGASRAEDIAAGFVGSFTLGAGQFCTKPGLLLAPASAGIFEKVREALACVDPLLTAGIANKFTAGVNVHASRSQFPGHQRRADTPVGPHRRNPERALHSILPAGPCRHRGLASPATGIRRRRGVATRSTRRRRSGPLPTPS